MKSTRIHGIVFAISILGTPGYANPTRHSTHDLIGLQLYTVRDDCAKDFPGTLAAVSKIGFKGVEFAGYYGRSADELRKMLDNNHLVCFGSHIQLNDLLGDNFDKTVAYNKTLGNRLLVVPSLPGNTYKTRSAMIEMARTFSDLARKLKPRGMTLAYHNHEVEFTPVEGEMPWDTFFSNASADVKIQFDIGNALQGGAQALPYLKKYPGRVVSVHVKDFSSTNRQALLGEGDEHWSDVLPVLKGRKGPHWFIIEQETYPDPPLICAEKCLRNFEKMLGE